MGHQMAATGRGSAIRMAIPLTVVQHIKTTIVQGLNEGLENRVPHFILQTIRLLDEFFP